MTISRLEDYEPVNLTECDSSRVSWQVDAQKSALLIHDMQDYFLNFYEKESQLIAGVIDYIRQLKQWAKQNGIPVYYTAQPKNQTPEERGLLTDMWGAGLTDPSKHDQENIVQELIPDADDTVLTKWRYSAFYKSSLLNDLKKQQKNQLIICGVYAHIGVLQTAAVAFMSDIKPFVVADAVADFSRENHLFALNYVQRNLGRVFMTSDLLS